MAELTAEQIQQMLDAFYPYKDRYPVHRGIPASGLARDEVLAQVTAMAGQEDALGDSGKVSGSIYLGDHDQYALPHRGVRAATPTPTCCSATCTRARRSSRARSSR